MRYGSRPPTRRGYERDVLEFWNHVTKTDGCWVWDTPAPNGYGRINFDGIRLLAHRVSWIIHNGAIPADAQVNHTCDVRLCVRPEHLYLGTQRDNVRDEMERGRNVVPTVPRGARPRISDEQVREIVLARRRGDTPAVIARRYGISRGYARNIVVGNCRKIAGASV